jgi:hypothetical protein
MPTIEEILKQTGLTDEQISALDGKVVSSFSAVLSTAENERLAAAQQREAAEVAKRSNEKFYDESIAPALSSWAIEKANLDGQLNFYKSQLESAKASGLEFAEPPGQSRDGQGRYVSGAPGSVPGSPTFTREDVTKQLSNGISNVAWAMQTHMKLTGEVLPDSFDVLDQEATNSRVPFRDYVARKYDYEGRQKAMLEKNQRERDDRIRAEAEAASDRKWAEKIGSNPDVRIAQPSRFADVARAVKAGERPDPLQLNDQQRRMATTRAIRSEIAERDMN